MLSRTRSFAPTRRTQKGFIDEDAVPDPDVILLADAVLAGRPQLSPPHTPRRDVDNPAAAASASATAASATAADRSGGRSWRIGRSTERAVEATVVAVPSKTKERDASHDDDEARAHHSGGSRDTSLERTAHHSSSNAVVTAHAASTAGPSSAHAPPPPSFERGGSSGHSIVGMMSQMGASLSSLTSSEESALRRRVEQLSAQLAATEAALRSASVQSSHWENCVHDLFNGLLLNPRMNARYERKARRASSQQPQRHSILLCMHGRDVAKLRPRDRWHLLLVAAAAASLIRIDSRPLDELWG